jgi:hypothetical protein
MPFNMAMEEPDTRIVSLKAEHGVRASVHCECVSSWGHSGEISSLPRVLALATSGTLANLELVAVEVERVDCGVEIVNYDLDYVTFVHYERLDGSVDFWDAWVGSAECCEQRWHLLWNVRDVVEVSSI